MDQYATWYGGRPRPRRHCVRWATELPLKGAQPHFSAHVYCGQTPRWIKIPLSMKAGIGPGHIVLHGALLLPPPQKKASHTTIFGPCLLWPNCRPYKLLLSTCCSVYTICLIGSGGNAKCTLGWKKLQLQSITCRISKTTDCSTRYHST